MFAAIITAIRTYIIIQLANIVAQDIVTNGLTSADEAIIDGIISS